MSRYTTPTTNIATKFLVDTTARCRITTLLPLQLCMTLRGCTILHWVDTDLMASLEPRYLLSRALLGAALRKLFTHVPLSVHQAV